jgi:PTH1 family peptidyl-tRNA hydrolase
MPSETFLIVGLGNPGEKYAGTRHNIGFDAVDAIARQGNASAFILKWEAMTARMTMGVATVHLVKPLTYMNLSGKAVARFIDFYKIPLTSLIVIHDDIDMKTGRLKLVLGGGTGGHNGIRSIVGSIGSNDFYRLKIGIGRPGSGSISSQVPVEKYVLTPFQQEEASLIAERMNEVTVGLRKFIEGNALQSMNFLNSFKG